jgi:putative aldouronate transport system permease protein
MKKLRRITDNAGLYLLLLPSFVLVLLFAYKPMYGIIMAFKDFRSGAILAAPWAVPPLKHFIRFFNSAMFTNILKNTIGISFYSLIAGFPFPILVALALNQMRAKKFKSFYQTVSYLPHFISTVVMVALILIWLNPDTGLWGNIYKLLNGTAGKVPNPMASASAFSSIYVWTGIWQHNGWNSIIYFAALAGIDPTLYEAATVDGASRMQKIRHIDLPLILPTACILLILNAGGIMNLGFEKVFLMQNNLNMAASEVISTYIYKIGLTGTVPQFSYSTAINLFNTVINLVLLITVNQASKRLSSNSLF